MLLSARVLDLAEALARKYGHGWATERSKRAMLAADGRRPGERSISRVERRLAREGRIERVRIMPGGRLPNGVYTSHGTTSIRVISRQEQRAKQRAAQKEAKRKPSPPRLTPDVSTPAGAAGGPPLTYPEWLRAHPEVSPEVAALVGASIRGRPPPF